MYNPYEKDEKFVMYKFKDREEWKSFRITGIGASDSSSILGINPYKTNLDLWKEKTDKPIRPDFTNPNMEYGTLAEAPLRDLFALTYKNYYEVFYEDNCILQSKEYPFMLCSPDGLIYDKEKERYGVYEGKTTSILHSMHKEKWDNQIPPNYFTQCLQSLVITGFEFCILNVELRYSKRNDFGEEEFEFVRKMYTIERTNHEEDIDYLVQEVKYFWEENVVNGVQPPLIISF